MTAAPGKDLMGISHWFHEVGTHLGFDTAELVSTVMEEHSLAHRVEQHYNHHIGKEPVEHTEVDCKRDHDDVAEYVHLLFCYASCW